MANTWCGYIDLLATRSIAERDIQDLRDALQAFHGALDSSFEVFKTGQCYAFSDGAFFKCSSFNDFVRYYCRVRNDLFQQKKFFRCAVIRGDIVVDGHDYPANPQSAGRRFFSMTFGGDAATAYQKESEFKGVGCSVEAPASGEEYHSKLTTSFFVTQGGGGLRAVKMTDIKFNAKELDRLPRDKSEPKEGERRVFDAIVESCQISISQSERVGAYYSTPLVTAIRSLDLSKVEYGDKGWADTPYAFEEMISGHAPRALRHMPGIHLVLLSCFDHLFRQKKGVISSSVQRQVLTQLMKFPQCFRRLDSVPNFVISHAARNSLIKDYVAHEKEIERNRRAARGQTLARRLALPRTKTLPSNSKKEIAEP